jgi:FG-GAP-like repeat
LGLLSGKVFTEDHSDVNATQPEVLSYPGGARRISDECLHTTWCPAAPVRARAGFANRRRRRAGEHGLGDVNGDGKLDLVVACGRSKSVTILLGQGEGRFRPAAGSPVTLAEGPSEMVLCDLNGDGKLDVAIASHDSYRVVHLLGDGKGCLTPAPNSPVVLKEGQHPHTNSRLSSDSCQGSRRNT